MKPVNADSLIRQWTDVHGIDAAPVEDEVDGYPRKVWWRDGADVIESITITGMAHGTPLATEGARRRGRAVHARGREFRRPTTSQSSSA